MVCVAVKSVSSFLCVLLIILHSLICAIHAQENVKNIFVKVLKSKCMRNWDSSCRNTYLQICYKKRIAFIGIFLDCLLPADANMDNTDLKAEAGSNSLYSNFNELASITTIVVRVTPTPTTSSTPLAASYEWKSDYTANGFRYGTRSKDDKYQFELLIEAICYNPNCFGHKCETCATVGTTQPVQSITLNKLRTITTITTQSLGYSSKETMNATVGTTQPVRNITSNKLRTTTTITTQSLGYSSKETMHGESCNDSPFVNCDKQTVCFVPTLKLLCPRTCELCGNTCKDNSAVNCNDINVCSIAHLREHCPLRCGLCSPPACVDSTVIHCENPGVCSIASLVQFCPLTCGGCVPPTKMPCRDGTLVNCKTEGICMNSVLKVHCDFTCGLCDKTSSTDTTYIGTTKKLGLSQIIGR